MAEIVAEKEAVFARSNAPVSYRSRDQILRMFDGFDLVEPGLTRSKPSNMRRIWSRLR